MSDQARSFSKYRRPLRDLLEVVVDGARPSLFSTFCCLGVVGLVGGWVVVCASVFVRGG